MKTRDNNLIERFQNGETAAFEEIVCRWEHGVLNLAYRLVGDRDEAMDIRQSTFMKVYAGLPAFNGRSKLATWLYRITVNLCRDRMRALAVREAALHEVSARIPEQSAPSPEHETERQEAIRLVAETVASLPGAEREVVVLRHYHGLSFPEIAAVVGSPASTVKSRMNRGIRTLRVRLARSEL